MIKNDIKPIIATAVEKCLEESMERMRNGMDTFTASVGFNGDEVDSRTKRVRHLFLFYEKLLVFITGLREIVFFFNCTSLLGRNWPFYLFSSVR